jgi:pyruvate formate lyase activating enzyme
MMVSGIVFDIKKFAVHDGPGIRTTIFLKGCAAQCWWCHNPESQESQPLKVQKEHLLEGTIIREEEEIGKRMTSEEVMQEIKQDLLFFEESGGGVTFSGGEPLMQPEFLLELLRLCRDNNIHTALDTSGHAPPEIFADIINEVDLFLYDLKIIDNQSHVSYTGLDNQPILFNLKTLINRKKKVILRFPVIPDITDTEQNLAHVETYIHSLGNGIHEINLLPFHNIAKSKYHRLGWDNRMETIKTPSNTRLQELQLRFEKNGFYVKIGG